MPADATASVARIPEHDEPVEALGLSGATLMQLWSIGVANLSDLTAYDTDSLRKRLADSQKGSAGASERIENAVADILAAMQRRSLSQKPQPKAEKLDVVKREEDKPAKLVASFEPDHEWLDRANNEVTPLSADPLEPYYREVRKFKRFLSREEQDDLGRRAREDGDIEARNTLVVYNLRLVLWIARKHLWATMARKKEWSALQLSDLVQEGNIGLMIAAERFDPKKGSFTTYAHWWIKARISRAILDSGFIRVPVHMGELISRVRRAMSEIALREGRPPAIEEIAAAVEQHPTKVRQALKAAQVSATMVSLDAVVDSTPGGGTEAEKDMYEFLADDRFLRPDRALEAKQELNGACKRLNEVTEALYEDETISDRDREIFVRFYGLDGGLRHRTLEHTAENYDMTRERVRQIIGTIWGKLQATGLDMDHESALADLARIAELEKLAGKRVSVD